MFYLRETRLPGTERLFYIFGTRYEHNSENFRYRNGSALET